MSQHHLTVNAINGTTIKLVAGWDNSMLQRFFLVLRDHRRPAPDEHEGNFETVNLLYYDSDERGGLRSVGDVETKLIQQGIPFSEEHVNAFDPDGKLVTNPKLLPLLCEILQEQQGELPSNRVKYWDLEPDPTPELPLSVEEAAAITEWDRQYKYRYSPADPHPVYELVNYTRWLDEQDDVMPYENWVRQQLVEYALQEKLA